MIWLKECCQKGFAFADVSLCWLQYVLGWSLLSSSGHRAGAPRLSRKGLGAAAQSPAAKEAALSTFV